MNKTARCHCGGLSWMDIIYRPATIDDLEPAARVVQHALNGLRVQHGLAATAPLRPPLFQRFSFAMGRRRG